MNSIRDKVNLERITDQRDGYRNLCLEYKDRIDNISKIIKSEMYNDMASELYPIIEALKETINSAEEQGMDVCLSNLRIIVDGIDFALENGNMKNEQNTDSDGFAPS
jgi:hypothetical protein